MAGHDDSRHVAGVAVPSSAATFRERASRAGVAAGGRGRTPALLAAVLVFIAIEPAAVASLGTPLLPTIQAADHVSLAASQWALTIALLVGAVAAPVLGRLGDGSLRRRAILQAIAITLAGCVLSALPAGFAAFLIGRALQGVGFGLVPLATAVARDDLPGARGRRVIVLIGITTAAGIGIGYPVVGVLAEYLGLAAPFWLVAGLSALVLAAAVVVLPGSPRRQVRLDAGGAALLGLGIAGLLLVLAEGPDWGWGSATTVGSGAASLLLLAAWAGWELRVRQPLIELRLLTCRPVLAANLTTFLVALGFYPIASLAVRFVQTPTAAGYGFGAGVLVAGLMLTPFSLASFAASRLVRRVTGRASPDQTVVLGCVLVVASMIFFLLARSAYWQIVTAMLLAGFGVGCVYAVNPLQIAAAVPAGETGSAMSFYQLARTVAYSIASALSATLLVLSTPSDRGLPASSGYSAAALASTVILAIALAVSLAFVVPGRARWHRSPPHPASLRRQA